MDPFVVREETLTVGGGSGVSPYRIVKRRDATTIQQASAATDKFLGISQADEPSGSGTIRTAFIGIVFLEYGGTVSWGDPLTSDANGKGVAAAPAAGVNNTLIGICMQDGVSGDIGLCLITISVMQG